MTIEGNGSELDLDAILAARWADPHVFPAAEFRALRRSGERGGR